MMQSEISTLPPVASAHPLKRFSWRNFGSTLALGLFVAQVGQEGLYAFDRFTFGWDQLAGGIALIPALVGAFGLRLQGAGLMPPRQGRAPAPADAPRRCRPGRPGSCRSC